METIERRPLRWRIGDFFAGPRGRPAILAIGAGVIALVVLTLVFVPYAGRPEIKEVGQTGIRCPAAFHAISPPGYSKAAVNEEPVRLCAETGRSRIFTASFFGMLIALLTLGAIWVQSSHRRPAERIGPAPPAAR